MIVAQETARYHCLASVIFYLSYDVTVFQWIHVTVFQWIASCNKKCNDHTCNNTIAGIRNVIDDVRNNNVTVIFIENMSTLMALYMIFRTCFFWHHSYRNLNNAVNYCRPHR